jgi:hypothetical protein
MAHSGQCPSTTGILLLYALLSRNVDGFLGNPQHSSSSGAYRVRMRNPLLSLAQTLDAAKVIDTIDAKKYAKLTKADPL